MVKEKYAELYGAQGGNCFYCGEPMLSARSDSICHMGWTTDHFIPKTRGGKSLNNNTVLCHTICNMRKGGRYPTRKEIARFNRLYARLKRRRKRITHIAREVRRHETLTERDQRHAPADL